MTTRSWKLAALIASGIAVSCIVWVIFGQRGRSSNPGMIVSQIRPLNQLTTVRYTVQRVIGIKEPKQPFGEESLLLMVQGDVLAGVNLANFTQNDVHFVNEHTVFVHLPEPAILEAFIDEKNTKVWDRQITWWTPWVSYDPDLEHRARLSAVNEIRNAAISDGILGQAQRNAQTGIRSFLSAMKIDVKFGGT
jgi:hypothetical protein